MQLSTRAAYDAILPKYLKNRRPIRQVTEDAVVIIGGESGGRQRHHALVYDADREATPDLHR